MSDIARIKSEILNNTNVANVIPRIEGIVNAGPQSVVTAPKEGAITPIDIFSRPDVQLDTRSISPLDMALIDTFCTLYANGMNTVTLEQVIRVLSGNIECGSISPSRYNSIQGDIRRLSQIRIKITPPSGDDSRRPRIRCYESYLLPVDEADVVLRNGRIVHAYKFLRSPALYDYAVYTKQLICVPLRIFMTQAEIKDTDDSIIIKRYLIKRIERMRNKNNSIKSCRIIYKRDTRDGEERGMFSDLGYEPKKYSDWRGKKKRIHDVTCHILKYFAECGYIKGYDVIKNGTVICGVGISV
jgi:hypothetical protein